MSSAKFEVTITPDPLTRAFVVGAGILLIGLGTGVLAFSHLPPGWRAVALAVWIVKGMLDFRHLRQAHQRVAGIVIGADSTIAVVSPDGVQTPVRYLTGTFAVPTVAWLRLRLPGGCRYGELLVARRLCAATWHRLQLIWQLGRRSFGHRGPA